MTKLLIDKSVVEQALVAMEETRFDRKWYGAMAALRQALSAIAQAEKPVVVPQGLKLRASRISKILKAGQTVLTEQIIELLDSLSASPSPAPAVPQFKPARNCGCKTAEDCDGFCRHGAPAPAVPDAAKPEKCPVNGDTEFGCKNRHQCWEPCGELGHSAEHARPAPKETQDAVNAALGLAAKPETQGAREELIRLLLEDAAHHREVASDCDCRPEDTVNWQHALRCEQAAALLAAGPAIPAPHECKTEEEKRAYAFGWWKALEHARAADPAHVEPLTEIDSLAKLYASSYASPHHITFTVDGLRNLISAAHGIGKDQAP